jgi:hypothetical protein
MITNISGTQIIKDIVKELLDRVEMSEECKLNIVEISAKFEHNLIRGRREITHLEAFISEFIYIINKLKLKKETAQLKF